MASGIESWEFVVEEVFRVTDRPYPFAMGVIRHGTVRVDDSFSVDGRDDRGTVVQIEAVNKAGRNDLVALATQGVELAAGDVLTSRPGTT